MRHRFLTLLVAAILSDPAAAAAGIKVRFNVEERRSTAGGTTDASSYENAYLFGFEEAVDADFKEITQISFTAKDHGASALLSVSLYDYIDGAAVFVGQKELSAKFNVSSKVSWSGKNGMSYVLHLLPSRAPLPNK